MRIMIAVVALLGCAGNPQLGAAQALPPCTDDSGHRLAMSNYLKTLVVATDSASVAMRTKLGIPAVAANKVTIITTNSICSSAGQAVSREMSVTPPNGRSVSVVKVGNSTYVVRDPTVKDGEWTVQFVFNGNFQTLKSRF
jgi:hypothetical protein